MGCGCRRIRWWSPWTTTASAQPEHAADREGLFGPVVDVPGDAPAFDLGFAGRDPAWTAASP